MIEAGISTHAFAYNRLDAGIIALIAEAGFDAVELYMHKPHFDFEDSKSVKEVHDALKKHNLKVNSIHCPFYRQIEEAKKGRWLNIASTDETLRAESVEWIKKSISTAEKINFEFAVIHFGDINDKKPAEDKWEAACRSINDIEVYAATYGVKPVLENIPNEIASCAEMKSFVLENDLTRKIGICFDTGHAAMAGEIPSGLELLEGLIRTVHLHDTMEYKDEHLSAGTGILDWRLILSHLKNSGYSGRLVLENKHGGNPKDTIKQAAESAEMLKKLWKDV
jgi:sugar phosphate isomerase/epimerase